MLRARSSSSRLSVALALAATVCIARDAAADTLVWKDGHQTDALIVHEFRDYLYVKIGAEPPRFVLRRDLDAVLDERGERQDPLRFGLSRAPSSSVAPLGAAGNATGDAWIERSSGRRERIDDGPKFIGEGDKVVTSDASLARVALPSSAVLKLAAKTTLLLVASSDTERAKLAGGEVFAATDGLPLEIDVDSGRVRCDSGVYDVGRADGSTTVTSHRGTLSFLGRDFRATLPAGAAASVDKLPNGAGWKIQASPTNQVAIELIVSGKARALKPGEAAVVQASGAIETITSAGAWRVLRASGDVRLRKGAAGVFAPVAPDELLRTTIASEDALSTGGNGTLLLEREDSAIVRLKESSALEVREPLDLARGAARFEPTSALPIAVASPGGTARLRDVVDLRRTPDGLEAMVVKGGEVLLPLCGSLVGGGPPGSTFEVQSTGPDGCAILARKSNAVVRKVERGGDPALACHVPEGRRVQARAGDKDKDRLELEGKRVLVLPRGAIGADVWLAPDERVGEKRPRVVFTEGATVTLAEEVTLELGRQREMPSIRWKEGERLLLDKKPKFAVDGKRNVVFADGTTIAFTGGVEAVLQPGEGQRAGATVVTRVEDRLEPPKGGKAEVGRRKNEYTTFAVKEGKLWIHDQAPPVQARQGGSLHLSMPGAPPLVLDGRRYLHVLATKDGEFVILDDPSTLEESAGIDAIAALSGSPLEPSVGVEPPRTSFLPEPPPASPIR